MYRYRGNEYNMGRKLFFSFGIFLGFGVGSGLHAISSIWE